MESYRAGRAEGDLFEPLEPRVLLSAVLYVDADPQDGTWAGAYADLTDALVAAAAGDQVWIARGTYVSSSRTDVAEPLALPAGVALYGGVVGGETSLAQADPAGNVTELLANPVAGVYVGDNHTIVGADGASLTGLVIAGAGDAFGATGGAGLYLDGGAMQIEACTFRDNYGTETGGGIHAVGADLAIAGSTFLDNVSADWGGGGLYASGGTVAVSASRFEGNEADYASGGGLRVDGSALTVAGTTFVANRAHDYGAGLAAFDAAVAVVDSEFGTGGGAFTLGGGLAVQDSQLSLENVRVVDNVSYGHGAGLWARRADVTVAGGLFQNNRTGDESASGAGAFLDGGVLEVRDSEFRLNRADGEGGAIAVRNGTLRMARSQLVGNETTAFPFGTWGGGAVALTDSGGTIVASTLTDNAAPLEFMHGGAVLVEGGTGLTIVNSVLAGNLAGRGGAVAAMGPVTLVNSTVVANEALSGGAFEVGTGGALAVTNSIVWANTAEAGGDVASFAAGTGPIFRHSLVQGSSAGWAGIGTDAGGNLDADPRFYDPAGGDWRLLPHSPALDAGHNGWLPPDTMDLDADGDTAEPLPLDLIGRPRRQDAPVPDTGIGTAPVVDMGAYEGSILWGDANGDGAVDDRDLSILLGHWGDAGVSWRDGDFTGDGQVDDRDLNVLLGHWGDTTLASESAEPAESALAAESTVTRRARPSRRRL